MYNSISDGNHFRKYTKTLELALKQVKTADSQKLQVEGLVKLEKQFRKALCDHREGLKVYEAFVHFILEVKKNILSARPYFRERQKTFSSRVSPALKKRNALALHRFGFNYLFVKFAMKVYRGKGKRRRDLLALANQIRDERDALIQRNLPLAINRAKMFYNKIPKSDREYMDYIQMANEGLISAVDKFVLPYRTVFRSVIIGRAVGNMTEASSDTIMHFFPSDKRILYKANSIIHRQGKDRIADVVAEINREKRPATKATSHRIDLGLEAWVRDVVPGCPPGSPYRLEVTSLPLSQRDEFLDRKIGERVRIVSTGEIVEIVELYEILTEGRLFNILKGSSHVSMDATLNLSLNGDAENANLDTINVHSRVADPKLNQEENLSNSMVFGTIKEAFETVLTALERKVLVLHGEFYD